MTNAHPPFRLGLLALLAPSLLTGCLSTPPRSTPPPAPRTSTDSAAIISAIGGMETALPKLAAESDADDEALSEADDLWERVRRGLALSIPDRPRVRKELDWLLDNPAFLERTAERATPYLHFIVEEAERRNMPLELALLPVIESGFQPMARSPYRAAGLWQFMPATGQAFGLKNTWWYDGRYDVTASTLAAMDYLADLAGQFDGDWELALAAYNAGPGTVRRAIRRNEAEDRPTDYWSLKLPDETRRYVPRLLAVAKVVRDPHRFDIQLSPLPNEAQFAEVELPRQIDLKLAAQLAEVDAETLKSLNPGLRRWATDPNGPHRLLLPIDKAEDFEHKVAQLGSERWVSARRYRIRRGDTVGGIAQRYGISVAELKRANHLRGSAIRAGHDLIIPIPGEGGGDSAAPVPAAAVKIADDAAHTVQPGDTLWDIARTNDLSHRQLAAWNGLSINDPLRPGQTLSLQPAHQHGGTFRYRVRSGDSLYAIARRFNVSVTELKRWNALPGHYLQPGQELTVRVREQTSASL